MSYRSEFPDYDGDFYCPQGWIDNSWHNNMSPHCEKRDETKGVRFLIWQNYIDVEKRENEDEDRYVVQIETNGWVVYTYETDDLAKVEEFVKGVVI